MKLHVSAYPGHRQVSVTKIQKFSIYCRGIGCLMMRSQSSLPPIVVKLYCGCIWGGGDGVQFSGVVAVSCLVVFLVAGVGL